MEKYRRISVSLLFILSMLANSCEEGNGTEARLPTVTTAAIGNITITAAVGGGEVTSDGQDEVTARGVCWSTNADPTVSDSKTSDGTGIGSFTSSLTDLDENTTYHVRAYATNNVGTAYGSDVSFTTLEDETPVTSVTDADNNNYGVVEIGDQIWMKENLKTTKYSDGTDITLITDSLAWLDDELGGYTWYRNDVSYKNSYGALYNWYAVNTDKLCPNGWHVPSEDEWATLENYLIANGYNYDGTTNGDRATNNKLAKAMADITTWAHADEVGAAGNTDFPTKRNASGFTARAAGYKDFYGSFGFFTQNGLWHRYDGINAAWWSSSEEVEGAISAWWREIDAYQPGVLRSHNDKYFGLSVRCVKN